MSCKKILDYRGKYTGDYKFKIYHTGGTYNSTWKDTVYYSIGDVMFGTNKNSLKITIGNFSFEPDISKDGILSNCRCGTHYTFSGKFNSKKNVTLKFTYSGLGGGSQSEYTGEKY